MMTDSVSASQDRIDLMILIRNGYTAEHCSSGEIGLCMI